mgnify:CR=1 FL=1
MMNRRTDLAPHHRVAPDWVVALPQRDVVVVSVMLIAALVSTFAGPGGVVGEAVAANAEADQQALNLASRAKEALRAGRHEEAAMLFKQAYAQVPEPTLIYNAARAYQLGNKLHEALSLFRLYLTLASHDDGETRSGRAAAVDHIATIEKEFARRRDLAAQAAQAAQPMVATPTQAPVEPRPALPTAPGPVAAPPAAMPIPAAPVRRPGLFRRVHDDAWTSVEIAAVSLLASGGALVAGSLVAHLVIGGELDAVEQRMASGQSKSPDGTFYKGVTQREAGAAVAGYNDARFNANAVLATGVVAGSIGAVLWLTRSTDDSVVMQPQLQIGRDFAMAGWSVSW